MSEYTRPCATCQYLIMLPSYPPKYKCELSTETVEYPHQCDYDIVPVVRCKDCRYWDRETTRQNSNDAGWWNEAICLNFEKREKGWDDFDRYTDADWFCAGGERREDDG